MASLEILCGVAAGQRFELADKQTLLGRDVFCDVVLPSRSISRQHARIVAEGDGFFLEDLQSLNGTFVNGQRVTGRRRLHDCDEIQLYEILMAFYVGQPNPQLRGAARATLAGAAPVPGGGAALQPTIVDALDASAGPSADVGARAKLQAVLEIMRNVGQTLEADVFLANILDSLFDIFPQADRGYVLLDDPAAGQLVAQAVKSRRGDLGSSGTMGPISHSVAQRVMTAGEAILSAAAESPDSSVLDDLGASSMTVPLMGASRQPLGLVYLEAGNSDESFNADDLDVLLSVGAVAGQAVELAQLHESRMRLDRRTRDLATAREVQRHFLPRERPTAVGYRFFDFYEAAEVVGGDYFGYIPLSDGRLAIAMGDVSGKGVSAALLMARLCSEVRYCLAISASGVDAVERLNRELSGATLNDRFVTFLLCILDPSRHELEIVNAGHLPPLARRGHQAKWLGLEQTGPPLGCELPDNFSSLTVSLNDFDSVLLCTDGITEARSPADAIYGMQRLSCVIASGPTNVDSLVSHVLDDVTRFSGSRPQSDDICVVAFGRDSLSQGISRSN